MKVVGLALFGAGYVLGSKAGHRRYEQIRALAQDAANRLQDPETRSRASMYSERLATFARSVDEDPRLADSSRNGSSVRLSLRDL